MGWCCTLVEQPADVAATHKNVHRNAQSDAVTYDEYGAPTEEMKVFIAKFMTLGPKGSRLNTHVKFLRHFEWLVELLAEATHHRRLAHSWNLAV